MVRSKRINKQTKMKRNNNRTIETELICVCVWQQPKHAFTETLRLLDDSNVAVKLNTGKIHTSLFTVVIPQCYIPTFCTLLAPMNSLSLFRCVYTHRKMIRWMDFSLKMHVNLTSDATEIGYGTRERHDTIHSGSVVCSHGL